jgi:hypothetical protein
MRAFPFTALIGFGCVSTSVAHLSPTKYESRSTDAPIALYSSQLPACAFTELAIVSARRETWMASTDAAVGALRSKAQTLGGDAVIRLAFGDDGEVTGTVIRFRAGRLQKVKPPPNKRLKLPGGDRSKGIRVLCAGAHELSFNTRCAGGRVARSLSAIR